MEITNKLPYAIAALPSYVGQSVGHLARTAVDSARESGISQSRNAQGVSASYIARGISPASVIQVLAESEPLNPIDLPERLAAEQTISDAEAGYTDAGSVVGDEALRTA